MLLITVESHIVAARAQVVGARATVLSCRAVPWTSRAADGYRERVDGVLRMLTGLLATLDGLVRLAASARAGAGLSVAGCTSGAGSCAASVAGLTPMTSAPTAGRSVNVGGGGLTSVDPDALLQASRLLTAAGRALDEAQANLGAIVAQHLRMMPEVRSSALGADPMQDGLVIVGVAVAGLVSSGARPGLVADHVQHLASAVQAAGTLAADGESGAQRMARGAAGSVGSLVGQTPVLLLAAPAVIGPALLWWRLAGSDRVSASDLVAAGGIDAAVTAFAAGLRAGLPGPVPFTLRPVDGATGLLAAVLARSAGQSFTVPVDAPPQLPTPHGLAGVIDIVARTYDEDTPTGTPGTAAATITVQRLDHPDGTTSWLVAVPGTRSMGLAGDVPTDNATNLRLAAGAMDDMTGGVITAMQEAGIAPDEPVVLAGHSQGGMVAMATAAAVAGVYRLGGVVTAGSPNVPSSVPVGVPLVRLEHAEDVVPRLDGLPTRVGPSTTRITRTLDETGTGVSFVAAHAVAEYRSTAAMVDAGLAAPRTAGTAGGAGVAPGVDALVAALGPEGTTATTMQFRVTRDIVAASTDPTTGLPRVPVMRAG